MLDKYARVFPTQVGVILKKGHPILSRKCIPHASGGDPFLAGSVDGLDRYSPRKWG